MVGGHIAKAGYGDGLKGVRIFSRKTLTMHRIADMTFPRWYPTATLLPNGKVTIMGGTVLPGSGEIECPIVSPCALPGLCRRFGKALICLAAVLYLHHRPS